MPNEELQRGFGLSTATYVVIASMVGTGILISPGYMMASLQNYPVIFGLWALGGLLAMCGALCVAELAAALPRSGGEYIYLREAYGPMPAFLSGWTSFFLGFSAPLAVAGYISAKYLLTPFGLAENEAGLIIKAAAAAIIVVVTLPNLFGHRQSAWTQNLTTVIKFGLFVCLVVLAFLFGKGQLANLSEGQPVGDVDFGTAVTQLFYVMFAYSGWNAASYLAGEVKNPGKILPWSLLLGAGLVIVLYLALNLVFAYAVPMADVGFDNAELLPKMAVGNLFGSRASNVFSVLLGLTFLATVSAFIITGPRVYYAMARDRLFPSVAGHVNSKGRVPVYAMIAQSVCAVIILFVTDFQNLYQYASVGLSLFALLFVGAVYVLRYRQPDMERPFRVPGYPVVPAIFMAVIIFMAVFAFKQWRTPSIYSLGSILLGIPVYYVWSFVRCQRDTKQ
ncbi:MAG: amino acid permease [Sedimentisphaerales bacterium]|nr:amino acid permease [Sedimentisphaerales bacterium]